MDIPVKEDIIFALDIGTRTVIGAVCRREGNTLKVIAQSIKEHDSRSMIDGQVHDIGRVSDVVVKVKRELEEKTGIALKDAAIAAAGRTLKTKSVHVEQNFEDEMDIDGVLVNSLELSGVNEAGRIIRDETGDAGDCFYCVGYSVVSYYLNGYPITNLLNHKGRQIGADVLATFLPQSVVNSLYKVLEKSGLSPISLTLEPIAALEAVMPENIRLLNIALLDIGAGTSDIAITKKGSIIAYGMVSVAGDEITEAIAEEYISDFNTAEQVKISASKKKKITFKDVTDTKVTVTGQEILDLVKNAAGRMVKEIANAVISLNGDTPKALFCVGGGSQTPGLIEALSNELKMDKQRITVKKRDSIPNLEVCDHTVDGPEGVTVIGIAIVAFKKVGHDFVSVYVNEKECRLFHSGNMMVLDVLGLIGYNPSALIGKNGRSIGFLLNGTLKRVFGGPPTHPGIYINSVPGNLESEVVPGDFINIVDASDGGDASPTVMDFIKGFSAISFSINGEVSVIEPECTINGRTAGYLDKINEGDDVMITMADSLSEQAQRHGITMGGKHITVNSKPSDAGYIVKDGDNIIISDNPVHDEKKSERDTIKVTINGKNVVLPGRDHIFIDVFNAIDLDLSNSKGSVNLSVNGRNAEYSQSIKDGDIIEIDVK